MSHHRPSVSPSPSPGPDRTTARQSMGPARGTPNLAPASPRPGAPTGARPTSELLGTGGMSFQTPEGGWQTLIFFFWWLSVLNLRHSGSFGPMV